MKKRGLHAPLFAIWSLLAFALAPLCSFGQAQAPAQTPPTPPAWAQPGSATHTQVAPPADFHRPTTTFDIPIGIFQGQSDVGSALVPGSSSFDPGKGDPAKGEYTIHSAGYNVWYVRDEFRYLWRRVSGDISLAADVRFPDPNGYGDRKAVLVIRQSLDDDAKEVVVALHGEGMISIAQRPQKGLRVNDVEYRIASRGGRPGGESPDSLVTINARRVGLEKHGDAFTLWVSLDGEPMHPFGPPIHLPFDAPFYVGIGFCSHLPDKSDTAILSNVVFEPSAGNVQ
jgi:hypothetical protein